MTRRARAAGLALLLLGVAPALAGYQAGMEAYRRGDLRRAIAEFQSEVQRHPGFGYGHFMMGVCYLKLKEYDSALSSLQKAIELDPDKLAYSANLAQVDAEKGEWDQVVAALEGKTDLGAEPEVTAQASFLLGFGYFNLRKYDRALSPLAVARKLRPDDLRVLSLLGTAQVLSGRTDEAIATLSAALKINPRHAPASQYLAEAFLAKAQRESDPKTKATLYESAARAGQAAVQAGGAKSFEALNVLARAYLGAERYNDALEAFDRAIAVNPAHGYAHFNKGQAYKGLGEWENAAKEYTRATQLLPDNPDVLTALAYAYEQLGQREEDGVSLPRALSFYKKSEALRPGPGTRDAIARVEETIRLREEAAQSAEKSLPPQTSTAPPRPRPR